MGIDKESGRALEAAIARRVLGLETEERQNTRTREWDFVCREPGKQWVRVPYYSRNLSACVKVELALQELGWKTQPRHVGNGSEVRVVLVHANGRTVEAVGHPDEALCRAALKAVEQA